MDALDIVGRGAAGEASWAGNKLRPAVHSRREWGWAGRKQRTHRHLGQTDWTADSLQSQLKVRYSRGAVVLESVDTLRKTVQSARASLDAKTARMKARMELNENFSSLILRKRPKRKNAYSISKVQATLYIRGGKLALWSSRTRSLFIPIGFVECFLENCVKIRPLEV